MSKFILIGEDKSSLIMDSGDFQISNLELYYKAKTHKNKKNLIKEINEFLKKK